MKRAFLLFASAWLSMAVSAQQDSVKTSNNMLMKPPSDTSVHEPDTIRVGNFVIVKQHHNGEESTDNGRKFTVIIRSHSHEYDTIVKNHNSAFSTNWLIFDLGFANYYDKTNYASASGDPYLHVNTNQTPFVKSDLKLLTKSSNVNIWIFMQKLNVAKQVLNFKYGLGLEMFNFRYDNNISYNKTPAYIFKDTLNFSKDKLYSSYATVPFMININPWPNKKRISLSFGASAGYLIGSHTKQKSDDLGKQKVRGDFDLSKWRYAYVAELALGPVRLYGSYSIQPLHSHTLEQYPYAVGIRFSSW